MGTDVIHLAYDGDIENTARLAKLNKNRTIQVTNIKSAKIAIELFERISDDFMMSFSCPKRAKALRGHDIWVMLKPRKPSACKQTAAL